ncbi:MAG: hypothetical protein MMC33_007269 [Icmadophila ericetorum]|nr:hypothetical protein [Icmadophila ericetorum]
MHAAGSMMCRAAAAAADGIRTRVEEWDGEEEGEAVAGDDLSGVVFEREVDVAGGLGGERGRFRRQAKLRWDLSADAFGFGLVSGGGSGEEEEEEDVGEDCAAAAQP